MRDSLEIIEKLGVPVRQIRAPAAARAARCGDRFRLIRLAQVVTINSEEGAATAWRCWPRWAPGL